jgi:AraC-like DNA-binding protein
MALRRAPWMFDPRYLRRPFYYMTEANRLATLHVLQHARYSLPFALFQFGHEIRVARLNFFYGILRRSGLDIEEKVLADGTFQFDQLIYWLDRRFQHDHDLKEHRYLHTDDEVIADLLKRENADAAITIQEIAKRYTYPTKYIEEVLWDKIETARNQHTGSRHQ